MGLKEVRKALKKVEDRTELSFTGDDFVGLNKEEKSELLETCIDEVEELTDDLNDLSDALDDYLDSMYD